MRLREIFHSAAKRTKGKTTGIVVSAVLTASLAFIGVAGLPFSGTEACATALDTIQGQSLQEKKNPVFDLHGSVFLSPAMKAQVPDEVIHSLNQVLGSKKTVLCTPEEYFKAVEFNKRSRLADQGTHKDFLAWFKKAVIENKSVVSYAGEDHPLKEIAKNLIIIPYPKDLTKDLVFPDFRDSGISSGMFKKSDNIIGYWAIMA